MKLMVIPVGRSLVFSGLVFFRITGKKYFVLYLRWLGEADIMWWLGDWIRLILHQLPLPRKSPEKGKNYCCPALGIDLRGSIVLDQGG